MLHFHIFLGIIDALQKLLFNFLAEPLIGRREHFQHSLPPLLVFLPLTNHARVEPRLSEPLDCVVLPQMPEACGLIELDSAAYGFEVEN